MRVVGIDRTRQNMGPKGKSTPDIHMDFKQGGGDLIQKIMTRAQVNRGDLGHVHVSPDCTHETIIQRMEVTQGRGKGIHGAQQREQVHDKEINEIIEGLKKAITRDPKLSFTIENPVGSRLYEHPRMKELGGEMRVVKYCCYPGYRWQKMTRIITNLGKFWTPRCEKKARWTRKCPHCTACRKGIAHDMYIVRRGKHDKRPAAKLEGFNKKASKNRIPPEMAEEWTRASMARRLAAQETM